MRRRFLASIVLVLATAGWCSATPLAAAAGGEPAACMQGGVPPDPGHGPTLVLGAVREEIAPLATELDSAREESVHGLRVVRGRLNGREVALATTGVGKVNAAMSSTLLIEHFSPREVIFTGIAGGLDPRLLPGDIVIGTSAVQHDFVSITADTLVTFAPRDPISGARNPLRLPADERLRDLALLAGRQVSFDSLVTTRGTRLPRIVAGVIATGDAFVASSGAKAEIRARVGADAVEMEGAAVAQVCHQLRVPWLLIRSLSDTADEAAAEDMRRFSTIAAGNAARLVMTLLSLIAGGESQDRVPADLQRGIDAD